LETERGARGGEGLSSVRERRGEAGHGEFTCDYVGAWVYELGAYGT
jgi:hypothetical protein